MSVELNVGRVKQAELLPIPPITSEEALWQEMERQTEYAPGGDRYAQTFCQAAVGLREDGGKFTDLVHELARDRDIKSSATDEGTTVAGAVNTLRSVAHYYAMENDPTFPNQRYLEPAVFKDLLESLAHYMLEPQPSRDPLWDALHYFLISASLPTTHDRRAIGPDLVFQTLKAHEVWDDIVVVDVGSSVGVVAGQLVAKNLVPMQSVSIVKRIGGSARDPLLLPDHLATERANILLRAPSAVSKVICVDPMPLTDETRAYARAALRVEGELDDPSFMNRYNTLAGIADRPEVAGKIGRLSVDFTDRDEVKRFFNKAYPDIKPDAFNFSTVINQWSRSEFEGAMDNVKYFGGRAFFFDFVRKIVKNGVPMLSIYENWHEFPFRYRGFEADLKENSLRQIMLMQGSRVGSIQLVGRLVVNGRERPVKNLVIEAGLIELARQDQYKSA